MYRVLDRYNGKQFGADGIRLDKYEIKFKNDKVYLISY